MIYIVVVGIDGFEVGAFGSFSAAWRCASSYLSMGLVEVVTV